MRKLFKILGLLLMVSSIFIGCKKEKGETGPEGPRGEQGMQGIPGKDGAVIHHGNGVPTNRLGKTGDMYLDISNSVLYGPKVSNDWGIPLDLRGGRGEKGDPGNPGPTGAAGAAGSKILNGKANPSSTSGDVGDYYLNTNNGDFFGPKTASGWGMPISLRGTANVISSQDINITWQQSGGGVLYNFSYSVPAPYLNAIGESSLSVMLNKGGAILGYMTDYYHYSLPYIVSDAKPYMYFMRSGGSNSITVYVRRLDNTAIFGQTGLLTKFRFVLVPAGVQISSSSGKNVGVEDLIDMDYKSVKQLLKL
jgi:hypothetical protein